jgi:RNA polymerase sigma-70 factor (ECF subfamily)
MWSPSWTHPPGAKAQATGRVLIGRKDLGSFLTKVFSGETKIFADARVILFIGAPGILLFEGSHVATAISLEIQNGGIVGIFVHRNPDKLRWFEHNAEHFSQGCLGTRR